MNLLLKLGTILCHNCSCITITIQYIMSYQPSRAASPLCDHLTIITLTLHTMLCYCWHQLTHMTVQREYTFRQQLHMLKYCSLALFVGLYHALTRGFILYPERQFCARFFPLTAVFTRDFFPFSHSHSNSPFRGWQVWT